MRKKLLLFGVCCMLMTSCASITSKVEEQKDNSKVAVLELSLSPKDFTLRNAEGEEAFYDSETMSYTGDMEIVDDYFTTMGYMVYVKDSDSYTFQTEDTEYEFSIAGHKVFVAVKGTNIQEISLVADGTVQLTGEDMEYEVGVAVYADGKDRIDTSGSGSGTVTITRDAEQ